MAGYMRDKQAEFALEEQLRAEILGGKPVSGGNVVVESEFVRKVYERRVPFPEKNNSQYIDIKVFST